ncbi:hypothetical protein OIU84_022741 [Salix udensis]|uniref:Uncharacterized protein n=1 Tax=Salix udensis TaxID=889485 RepID=A0AAD6PEU5_9ROSI|nr:hypothetical protein OIU84_022741 [Salix udensis]
MHQTQPPNKNWHCERQKYANFTHYNNPPIHSNISNSQETQMGLIGRHRPLYNFLVDTQANLKDNLKSDTRKRLYFH